jgi:hypothetical protein
MFFVDRDCDTPLSNTNPDLFETPCYSVENLYAQESVLCRILKSEFGLNIIDSDYQKCLNDYRARLKEFNQSICKFNAIVKYQHQFAPDVNCRFSTIKTSNLAHITIGQVTKSCRHDSQIDKLVTLLSADQERLSTLEKELSQEENPQLTFRGKNQLDFFVAMIKLWRDLNDNGGYFAEKIERVHINISDNRLSELSQYAVTPSELVGFLENHRLQIAS